MAKQSTQATKTTNVQNVQNVKPSEEIIKAVHTRIEQLAGVDAGKEIADNIKRWGRERYENAASAALAALERVQNVDGEVRRMETEISLKKEGNGHTLLRLAKECVRLTMSGNTANLADAAELMAAACDFAEADTMAKVRAANPNFDGKIRDLVPSWPVLRANQINAMKKAKLNPNDFAQPGHMRKAYDEWKEKNPEQKDNRGAKPRQTDAAGSDKPREGAQSNAMPKEVAKLTDGARNAIIALTQALQGVSTDQQPRAVEIIEDAIKRISALTKAESKDAPSERRRPTPASVPESNAVAS